MNGLRMTVLAIAAALVLGVPAAAQKGMGEPTGVAREMVKPPVQKMSGTVTDVKVGECEQTTGRSTTGAHLIVRTKEEKTINLHLGPLTAVEHVVEKVPPGTPISFDTFRTEAMPEDAYVAKSITVEDKVIHLRDKNLRPSWAVGRGPRSGKGAGRGQGKGRGPGGGRGPCWW